MNAILLIPKEESKVSPKSLNLSDHEFHVGAGRGRLAGGHHSEEVGQTFVVHGLVAHHHASLQHHSLLHQRSNLKNNNK